MGTGAKCRPSFFNAPVTQDYANRIEADGYAPDVASGVDVAKRLLLDKCVLK